MVNEWTSGLLVNRVDPVWSISTAASWVPLAGSRKQPTSEGHIPTTVAIDSAARPIGTIAFVVADWLVVKAHTRNRATARNSGCAVTMSPIEVITIGLASRYVAVIHASPNKAIAATRPEEMSGCFATSPGLM